MITTALAIGFLTASNIASIWLTVSYRRLYKDTAAECAQWESCYKEYRVRVGGEKP